MSSISFRSSSVSHTFSDVGCGSFWEENRDRELFYVLCADYDGKDTKDTVDSVACDIVNCLLEETALDTFLL